MIENRDKSLRLIHRDAEVGHVLCEILAYEIVPTGADPQRAQLLPVCLALVPIRDEPEAAYRSGFGEFGANAARAPKFAVQLLPMLKVMREGGGQ